MMMRMMPLEPIRGAIFMQAHAITYIIPSCVLIDLYYSLDMVLLYSPGESATELEKRPGSRAQNPFRALIQSPIYRRIV